MFEIVLRGTNKELHFSSTHENLQDPHLHPAVGNKYVCMVGCRSGVAFFTVAKVLFKSLVQRGGCKDSDQEIHNRRGKLHLCKSVSS